MEKVITNKHIYKFILSVAYFISVGSIVLNLRETFPFVYNIFSWLTYVIFLTSSLFLLNICLRKKIQIFNKFDYLLIIFFLLYGYFSMINEFNSFMWFNILSRIFTLRNLLFLSLYTGNIKRSINLLTKILEIFLILNTLLIFLAPNFFKLNAIGQTQYLLSSNYNQFGGFYLFVFLIEIVNHQINGRNFLIIQLISIFTVLYLGSMTSVVSIGLFIIIYNFRKCIFFTKLCSKILIVGIVLFFLIYVTASLQFGNLGFVESFTDILGKDMTFSRRTLIWISSLDLILSDIFQGYGAYEKEWAIIHLHGINPHNIILQVLLICGVLGLITYGLLNFYALYKSCIKVHNKELKFVFLNTYLIYFLMQMFEVYNLVLIFSFIYILYLMPSLIESKQILNIGRNKMYKPFTRLKIV